MLYQLSYASSWDRRPSQTQAIPISLKLSGTIVKDTIRKYRVQPRPECCHYPLRFVILSAAKDLCTPPELPVAITFSTQIAPRGILLDNKCNFLVDTEQSLDLLLTRDRVADILKALEVHEPVQLILRAEARPSALLVLPNTAQQVICDACVKRFRAIRHDVRVIIVFTSGMHGSFAALRMTSIKGYDSASAQCCDGRTSRIQFFLLKAYFQS